MRSKKVKKDFENFLPAYDTDLFGDYLIWVGRRLKLEVQIGDKDDMLIRKEVSFCIQDALKKFDKYTVEEEEEQEAANRKISI